MITAKKGGGGGGGGGLLKINLTLFNVGFKAERALPHPERQKLPFSKIKFSFFSFNFFFFIYSFIY